MSKLKRSCNHNQAPLQSDFGFEKQKSWKGIFASELAKTTLPETSSFDKRFASARRASASAPRSFLVAGRFGKSGQSSVSLKISDLSKVKLGQAAGKSVKPQRKLVASNREKAGGSGKKGSSMKPSKMSDQQQCHCERKETLGKAAKNPDITLCPIDAEKMGTSSKSKPEPAKSSYSSDEQAARRGSGVCFDTPVATEIPICDFCSCWESCHFPARSFSESTKQPPGATPKGQQNKVVVHPSPTPKKYPKEVAHPAAKSSKKKSRGPVIVVSAGDESKKTKEPTPKVSSSSPEPHRASSPSSQQSDHSREKQHVKFSNSNPSPDSQHPATSSHENEHCGCLDSGSEHQDPSSSSLSCANCAMIVGLCKQLSELNRKLDGLNATVKSLSEKKAEKEEPTESASPDLDTDSLGTCQFCRGLNLPLLESFQGKLRETIGQRSFTDVVMSVFLRADNIYHVNVRDLASGCSLACFLVTDNGIAEAQQMGFFKEILTFCVIDVRNTLKPKNLALGITFELIDSGRQKGGSDSLSCGLCMASQPFVARVLGLPLKMLKFVYTSPESCTNYPMRAIRGFREHVSRMQHPKRAL